MTLLVDYIISITNLYGLISKDEAIEIYNMQNNDKINRDDLEEIVERLIDDLTEGFAFVYRDHFVQEAIYIFDEFDIQLAKRQGKPYYSCQD